MNSRQLRLIAILLGLAVLLYLPRLFRDDGARGTIEVSDGFRFELVDPLTRIDIVQPEGMDTIRLERTSSGWTVDGYRADEAKIADLLGVLPHLSSDALVARNPSNHAAMGVSEGIGRRIEVYTEAGGPLTFYLGERDLAAGGYFVRAAGSDPVFRLEGPAGGYLGRNRDGWRVRLIAAIDTAAVREIILQRGEREAVLRRETDTWAVGDAAADMTAVSELLTLLPGLTASGFPTDEEVAAADFSSPDAELDVFAADEGDVTGRRLVLSLRLIEDPDRGDWLARLAGGSEVYRLADFTVSRLIPEDLFP